MFVFIISQKICDCQEKFLLGIKFFIPDRKENQFGILDSKRNSRIKRLF